ncbi:MAG: YqjD family protein [Burkholderiales bacterium]
MTAESQVSKEKLVTDLKVLVGDTEELLKATAGQAGEKIAVARERIQASLAVYKDKLMDAEQALREKTKEAARATDEYVHDHPWQAVGVAAGVGFLLGLLVSRR